MVGQSASGDELVDGPVTGVSALQPPFSVSDTVMAQMCKDGRIDAYIELWRKYYDSFGVMPVSKSPSVASSVVCSSDGSDGGVGMVDEGREASVAVSYEGSDDGFKGSIVKRDETSRHTDKKVYAGSKTPWSGGGSKLVKTLSDQEILQYGDGACYLHVIRAECAAQVYGMLRDTMDMEKFVALPVKYMIPRADMRYKAVSVSQRKIHIYGTAGRGWSFYTVLQAAARAGMKGPILEGLEPGISDLRVDGTFVLGGMVASSVLPEGGAIGSVQVSRGSVGVRGLASYSFDDGQAAVLVKVPLPGPGEPVVLKDKAVLRVGVQDRLVDVVFPFTLTKQVVTWEVTGSFIRVLHVKVVGVLVVENFFPYAKVTKTVSREKSPVVMSCDADRLPESEVYVVDTVTQATSLVLQGGLPADSVFVSSLEGRHPRVCYIPFDGSDPSVVKLTVRRLAEAAVTCLFVVGTLGKMNCVSGMQPPRVSRFHRWYELQEKGAVALSKFSKVFVQSEVGYLQACEVFGEELQAGAVTVERFLPGVDCRRHVVCVYVEPGETMCEELIKEVWSGEADEYVLLSSAEQPVDWWF